MAAVIQTDGLTRGYGRQTAVDGLSLEIAEREIFGFLGPNGAGKTTTILMLLGLTEPTAGRVRVLGFNPAHDPLEIKRQVGYLPENVGFYDDLTGRENLRYIARLNRLPKDKAGAQIETALSTVGLNGEGDKLVGAYSRGMRQRLGIAELLLKEPQSAHSGRAHAGPGPGRHQPDARLHRLAQPRTGHHRHALLAPIGAGPAHLRPGRHHDQGQAGGAGHH